MDYIFKLNEFSFSDDDLATPDKLMKCLRRTDPAKINEPFYATKLFDVVTNRDIFTSDEWYDLGFEVHARSKLQDFVTNLNEWHQTNVVKQQFLPDILVLSFPNTSWVQEDLTAAGMVPEKFVVQTLDTKYSVEVLHSNPSM